MSNPVSIYSHNAKHPDRYYYDTTLGNNSGWSEGVTAFHAFSTQQPGTVPIYRHNAKDPDRYYYDTQLHNNSGWSEGIAAFYAFSTQQPGTVPIYRHNAKDPDRYYYDTQVHNTSGWSEGVVAFYAYPPGWMSLVDGNTLLSELSLAGTHDSMSRYGYGSETQSLSLTQQLSQGIRVFDIRLRYLKGANGQVNFSIHHSSEYQYAFFDSQFPHTSDSKFFVLDECLAFLARNPNECIVMLIKQEKDEQVRATFFEAFWKIVDTRPSTAFYAGNTVPRLADVRGKIVFAFVDGDSGPEYQLTAPRWGLYWGNMDYEVDPNQLQVGQQPGLDVENHWSDLMDSKWSKVEAHLARCATPSAATWYLTFVSASRTPDVTHFPVSYADYLLPKLQTYLSGNLQAASSFGTVMMDFPRASITSLLIAKTLDKHRRIF